MYLLDIEDIFDQIANIFDFIVEIFRFIGNLFKGLYTGLSYMIGIIPKLITAISTLPIWLTSFASITIAVCIAYFIIGRQTGKSD